MGEPVPVLAVAQLLERTTAALVRKLQAEGVPVLVQRDRVLTYWDSIAYSTQAETQSVATLPGGRSQRPRYDDSPPTDAELEEIEAQMWDEHLAREAADAEAAEEREYFLDRIAAGVARAESGWVRCPDVSVELDGEEDVLVVHVLRWPDLKSGLRFGTLLQANGSPGVTFAQLKFCFPHRPAVDLLRMPQESDSDVQRRIQAKVKELTVAAEAERARRLAEIDFNSPWRHSRRRCNHAEDDQLRATDRDDAALGGPFWRHGESRPEGAPIAWTPLDEFSRDLGTLPADIVKAAADGAFSLHVYARNGVAEHWPWGAPGSEAAAAFVAKHDIPLPGSGYARRCITGLFALEQRDLAALCDSADGSIVATRLLGVPNAQDGDARDRSPLALVDPPKVRVCSSDLWIGPDGQAGCRERWPGEPRSPLPIAFAGGTGVEGRRQQDGSTRSVHAGPGKAKSDAYTQRDIARIGLALRGAFPPQRDFIFNERPSFRAFARAIASDQGRKARDADNGGDAQRPAGLSAETLRGELSDAHKSFTKGDVDAAANTIALGALVSMSLELLGAGAVNGIGCAQLGKNSSAPEFASAIHAVLPRQLADRADLTLVALEKLVREARRAVKAPRASGPTVPELPKSPVERPRRR